MLADEGGVLTAEALELVAALQREFGERRRELLEARVAREKRILGGELPNFLEETRSVREGDWRVAPVPADLQDRRVEITGPAGDRKMVINAFNSGAKMYMADFEDANSPTWENVVGGQQNLTDAIDRTISVETPEKSYAFRDEVAVLLVRPRGWHLLEQHVEVDGEPVSASLFDFGIYLHRNAERLLARGSGPYFYLPKLESHLEARLWNDVFRSRAGAPRPPAGDDQGDRPHRDDPRVVRDGRDPVRAARALRRPQRRPLGLHLLGDQEVPRASRRWCFRIARR